MTRKKKYINFINFLKFPEYFLEEGKILIWGTAVGEQRNEEEGRKILWFLFVSLFLKKLS